MTLLEPGRPAEQARETGRPPRPAGPLAVLWAGATIGVVALVVALAFGGGGPQPAPAGLPDPGPLTAWGLPLLRLAVDALAVGTVGLLVTGSVLLPAPHRELGALGASAVRAAAPWAALWCLGTLALLVLTASETLAVPAHELPFDALVDHAGTGRGRALLLSAALSAAVAVGALRARTTGSGRLLLLGGLGGVLPPLLTGHAATAADHDRVTTALLVHVVAASLWVGGLLAVLLRLHAQPAVLAQVAPRLSALALGCFGAVGVSGLIGAWARLGASLSTWTSGYGLLVLGKVVALVLLGAAGWQHRRRVVPALLAGRPRAFLALVGGELALMGGAIGLAAGLARTPTPVRADAARPAHGTGHETLGATVEPLTWSRLLLEWRPDAVVVVGVGVALGLYLTGVRRLVVAGRTWPWRRTAAFTGGAAVVVVALCGGTATYAPAVASVQLGQFVLLLLPAPALLVLGAPLTLWMRVRLLRGGDEPVDAVPRPLQGPWARVLSDPTTGLVLVTVLVLAVYRTPFIELSLRSFWAHLLVNVLALLAGAVLLWPVLGADPVPVARSTLQRALPLVGVVMSLGLLAAQLRYGDRLLAGQWFLELAWPWVDPVADQRRGALLVAAATALLVPLLALGLRTPSRSWSATSVR